MPIQVNFNSVFFRNMTVFWLHGEDFMFSSSVHHVQQRIPQMKMMKVHIPFTFKLQESSTPSYTGEEKKSSLTVFLAVPRKNFGKFPRITIGI